MLLYVIPDVFGDAEKSITKQLKEDTENMTKQKGRICSLILEKQKRKASLESDLSTRTQVYY